MAVKAIDLAYRNPIANYGFQTLNALGDDAKLRDVLNIDTLNRDLARNGALIARGFADDLDEFNETVESFSSRVTKDPARKSSTKSTAEIKAGVCEMGLHRENGNLPFCPDLQWFYCLEAAENGSETTMCDGVQVYQKMNPGLRRMFESKPVKFDRLIPWQNVRTFLSVELEQDFDSVTFADLDAVNELVPNQKYSIYDSNLIRSELTISAIATSSFSKRPAFCNSLLGPSVNYEPPVITWADGSEIPMTAWDQIRRLTEELTYDHFWEKGDMVVIDNARVMHGRRHLDDPGRRIFGAQSYRLGEQ